MFVHSGGVLKAPSYAWYIYEARNFVLSLYNVIPMESGLEFFFLCKR